MKLTSQVRSFLKYLIQTKNMAIVLFVVVLFAEADAYAYVGPGAGFAFVSSFIIFIAAFFLAFVTLITWPIRTMVLFVRNRKIRKKSKVKRIVIVGLDGLDPELAQRYIENGDLPNFKKLVDDGSFRKLKTTTPSISPVAWSTFSTGVNPGKHSIFDFYTRDANNYMPTLSSANLSTIVQYIKIGPIKIPYKSAKAKFLRRSVSFWKILGKHGIFSSIIRVPITFPPEKFYGACLAAMCTPDLIGTQGTFTQFRTINNGDNKKEIAGNRVNIKIEKNKFSTNINGPVIKDDLPLKLSLKGEVDYNKETVLLNIAGKIYSLKLKEYSDWIQLEFKVNRIKKIKGIVRFLVTELKPELKIYMTPINIDPGKPSIGISYPYYYSAILSKLYGSYASLGLAEDTWALNERVIDEDAFLRQSYDIFKERKLQLMDALKKNKRGVITTVFDTTDRIQHMFFRYLCNDHPANKGKDTEKHKDTIHKLYIEMDKLIKDVGTELNKNDLLMILSDHGFKSFKWGVNLNSWLFKEGYIKLLPGIDPQSEWLAAVDWKKTKAFAYGLSGIFLNVKGRESKGTVDPGDERLKLQIEIKKKLEKLEFENNDIKPVRRVILAQEELTGPYVGEAPDLFVGYNEGYRVSWNSALGKITDDIYEENTKSWSGDHSIDPELVPGVFFSNWKLENKSPSIEDIAPTVLSLLGVSPKRFHDGKVLKIKQ